MKLGSGIQNTEALNQQDYNSERHHLHFLSFCFFLSFILFLIDITALTNISEILLESLVKGAFIKY